MRARLTAVALALAMAAAIFLLVWPVYSGFDGERTTHATLLQINGGWAVVPVIFPVLVALVPLVFRRQVVRIVAAIVMGGFVFISGFSIGLFYLPAGILMKAVAARQRDAARQPPEVRQEVGDCGRKDGVSSKLQRAPGRFRRC